MSQYFQNSKSSSTIVEVTPAVAEQWCSVEASFQRSVSPARVDQYCRMMQRGEWKLNPLDLIGISPNGEVIQGQHRLLAVIKSGLTVPMWVCFNCSPDIFDVLDRGKNRTAAQIAGMSGFTGVVDKKIATLNTLLWDSIPLTARTWSVEDILFLLQYYETDLDVIFPHGYNSSTQILLSPFRGAMLRALFANPDQEDEIRDIVKLVADGNLFKGCLVDPTMPLMFRSWVMNPKSRGQKEIVFLTCLKMVRHTLNGTIITHKNNLPVSPSEVPKKINLVVEDLHGIPPHCSARNWIEKRGGNIAA